MRSSGDVEMHDLRAGSLTVGISSSGDVLIGEGEVDDLDLTISSSGDYRGESVHSCPTCRASGLRAVNRGLDLGGFRFGTGIRYPF